MSLPITPFQKRIFFLLVFFASTFMFSYVWITGGESALSVLHQFGIFESTEDLRNETSPFPSSIPDLAHVPTPVEDIPPHSSITGHAIIPQAEFIAAASRVLIPRFDPVPIQEMCSDKPDWRKDLVIDCSDGVGGLNNVRQQMLTCVRWAMEFRAALIVPAVRPRLETNSNESVVHDYVAPQELSILFDQQEFVKRLREGCPQLRLYKNKAVFSHVATIGIGTIYPPKRMTREGMRFFSTNWTDAHPASDGKVRVAHLRRTATQYDVCYDGVEFANSFGQIVPLRKDAYYLAAVVLYELCKRFSLDFEPQREINPGAFVGVHLRTSSDAVKEGWMSYEEQSVTYQKYTKLYNLSVIYVASGNLSSTALFAKAVLPTPVVTKTALLSGKDLVLLNSMSWDQQAEVDYLVLLRSSRFLGMSDSTFSYGIAVARRAETLGGTCGAWQNGTAEKAPETGLALKDELSVVIGPPSKYHFGPKTWP